MATALLSCISDESLPWSDSHEYATVSGNISSGAEQLRPYEVVKTSNSIRCASIAFEKYMIYGGFKEIKVFELETGAVTTTITGDFGWVNHLSVVYGVTTLIVSAHEDGAIRTWELFGDQYTAYSAQPTHELSGHFKRATSTAVIQGVSPLVVSGSMDGTLRIWDLVLEQPVAFSFHRNGITCVAASMEEPTLIASGDENGEVIIWSLSYPELEMRSPKKEERVPVGADRVKPTLKPQAAVRLSDAPVTCLTVLEKSASVKERLLLIAREDGNVCVRRMADAELVYSVAASGSPITGMSVLLGSGSSVPSPASKLDSVLAGDKRLLLLTTCADSVRIWDAVRCELLGSCFGHYGDVLSVCSTGKRIKKMKKPRGLGSRSDSSEGVFSFTSMLQAAGMIKADTGNHSDGSTSSDEESCESEEHQYADSQFIKHPSVSRVGSRDSSVVDTEIESICSGPETMHSIVTTGIDGRILVWEFCE